LLPATQRVYTPYGLGAAPEFQLPTANRFREKFPAVEQRAEFEQVTRASFEIPMRHTSASYVGWLRTDSLVNTFDDVARQGCLGDIATLIDMSYDGAVDRNFVYEVIAARRR
jgi:hypothetical protein